MDDPRILELFRRQHGVAHTRQLRQTGVAWSTLRRARALGALVDALPDVVRLASAPDTFLANAMGLQLHSAPDGFLSGFTAGAMQQLKSMRTDVIYVTVLRHRKTTLSSWADRSYSNWHGEHDVIELNGFRVEEPHSMMFTLAACCNDFRFERAAESAWHRKLITPESCRSYVEKYRRSGRSGVARLNRWLDKTEGRTRAMQSNFEVDVLDAIRRVGLPEPDKQYPLTLASGELIHLDLAWPDRRFAVEPGHSWHHRGDLLTRRDEGRDRACNEVGWLVTRYDEDARRNLGAVGAEIAAIYRTRASTA